MREQLSSEHQAKHGMPWHKWVVVASAILWLASTALPVWETRSEFSGNWETVPGVLPAFMGWFGIFMYCPAWFANIGLIPLCTQLWKRNDDFIFGVIVWCTAVTAYMMPALYDDTGKNLIMARYIGFYVWLATFLVLLGGHAALAIKKNMRSVYIYWITVSALVAAIIPLEIWFPVSGSPLEHALKNPDDIIAFERAMAKNPSQADKDAALWWTVTHSKWKGENAPPHHLQKLVAAGANPNQADKFGATPLKMMLHRRDAVEYIAFLVQAGADVNARDHRGKTILDNAHEYQCTPEVIKILTDAGAVRGELAEKK